MEVVHGGTIDHNGSTYLLPPRLAIILIVILIIIIVIIHPQFFSDAFPEPACEQVSKVCK